MTEETAFIAQNLLIRAILARKFQRLEMNGKQQEPAAEELRSERPANAPER
jgi:hypothetical protein